MFTGTVPLSSASILKRHLGSLLDIGGFRFDVFRDERFGLGILLLLVVSESGHTNSKGDKDPNDGTGDLSTLGLGLGSDLFLGVVIRAAGVAGLVDGLLAVVTFFTFLNTKNRTGIVRILGLFLGEIVTKALEELSVLVVVVLVVLVLVLVVAVVVVVAIIAVLTVVDRQDTRSSNEFLAVFVGFRGFVIVVIVIVVVAVVVVHLLWAGPFRIGGAVDQVGEREGDNALRVAHVGAVREEARVRLLGRVERTVVVQENGEFDTVSLFVTHEASRKVDAVVLDAGLVTFSHLLDPFDHLLDGDQVAVVVVVVTFALLLLLVFFFIVSIETSHVDAFVAGNILNLLK